MNVEASAAKPLDSSIWEAPEMRTALFRRDLARIYRLLGQRGVSQGEISRRTGQSKAEIYEILHKSRQVQAYEVLVRIACGLGIPRGYMGLAYDQGPAPMLDRSHTPDVEPAVEPKEVEDFLGLAAALTVGAAPDDSNEWWQPFDRDTVPPPSRIGTHDVDQVVEFTAAMRALDYKHGGGACRDAVVGRLRGVQHLLRCDASDETRQQLYIALADLHNLAAWTSADVGLNRVARRHFARALRMAFKGGDQSLAANVLYRAARLHLHCGITGSDPRMYTIALKLFGLGRLTAEDAGCPLSVAVLSANIAWVYALLDDRRQMQRYIGRAEDEYARAERDTAQPWVRFFGPADLNASVGVALTAQPDPQPTDLAEGISHLVRGLEMRDDDNARSRCFEQAAVAVAYLRHGSPDLALHAGDLALKAASKVDSVRTLDRLTPLQTIIDARYSNHPDLKDLAHRVTQLRKVDA